MNKILFIILTTLFISFNAYSGDKSYKLDISYFNHFPEQQRGKINIVRNNFNSKTNKPLFIGKKQIKTIFLYGKHTFIEYNIEPNLINYFKINFDGRHYEEVRNIDFEINKTHTLLIENILFYITLTKKSIDQEEKD